MKTVVTPGMNLLGRYVVVSRLGEGGFAEVFRAYDPELKRDVALKILKTSFYGDCKEEFLRYQREVRLLAQLSHKNILMVYSFGWLPDTSPCIVMEYLPGQTMSNLISSRGRLDLQLARNILLQVCDGLAEAHKAGVVHRDLSPANIFMTGEFPHVTAKIIDFGLAKMVSDISVRLTGTGNLVGNPPYMSPELICGKEVDQRSDIYAVGCILYEMLCGRAAFHTSSPLELLHLHKIEYPVEPEFEATDWEEKERLKAISLRCLQKDVDARFQSCDQLIEALRLNKSREEILSCATERPVSSWKGSTESSPRRLPLVYFSSLLLLISVLVAAFCLKKFQENKAVSTTAARLTKDPNADLMVKERALSVKMKHLRSDDPDLLDSIIQLAGAYQSRQKYTQAVALWKRALELREKLSSREKDNQTGIKEAETVSAFEIKRSLAACYSSSQNFSEEENLLKAMLKAREAEHGSESPLLIGTISSLALCCQCQNKWLEAAAHYTRTCKIRAKTGYGGGVSGLVAVPGGSAIDERAKYVSMHNQLAADYEQAGNCFMAAGRAEEAVAAYLPSLDSGKIVMFADQPGAWRYSRLRMVLESLPEALKQPSRESKSAAYRHLAALEQELGEHLSGIQNKPGEEDLSVNAILQSLAACKLALGKTNDAENLYRKSALALEKNGVCNDDRVWAAHGFFMAACCNDNLGRPVQALSDCQKAVEIAGIGHDVGLPQYARKLEALKAVNRIQR